MIPLLLAAVLGGAPVQIAPAAPTVGDPIEIRFEGERGRITLEESDDYEVVRSGAPVAVVRAFRPGAVTVRGRVDGPTGSFGFRELRIEVRSVLGEDDSLEPAPYRPPREIPPNRAAWWAIGGAALAAIALWAAVLRRREAPAGAPSVLRSAVAPRAEYLAELRRARVLDLHPGIVVIAGAMRRFLARVHPAWGLELTSRELRRELRRHRVRGDSVATVDQVLLEADLEKFSPWGAPEVDKDALIDRAERLVDLDHGTAEVEAGTGASGPSAAPGDREVGA